MIETTRWDAAEHIKTREDVAVYLEAAFEDGDPAVIAAMLSDIARSDAMTKVALEAGVTREALSKALDADSDPKLSTLLGVIKAFGLVLKVAPAEAR